MIGLKARLLDYRAESSFIIVYPQKVVDVRIENPDNCGLVEHGKRPLIKTFKHT